MPHSVHTTPGTATPTESQPVPYWNVNVREHQWTEECPEWLQCKDPRDGEVLATKDEEFQRLPWSEVQALIATNRIDLFVRRPSDLRRYLHYIYKLKQTYGSVLNYIQHERLQWDSTTPSSALPFANELDYKILANDWPYGIDLDITHLVIWTKFPFEEDLQTGDLTKRARDMIEDFVQRKFCEADGVERDTLVWFKNWASLKSVHAVEHFHVMLYKAPIEFLERITGGDRPMSEKV